MSNRSVGVALATLLFAAPGCDNGTAVAPGIETFVATLNGASVRPTAVTTPATGTFSASLIGNLLSWKLDVSNISNVFAAHIHAGGPEAVGGVIVDLNADDTGPNFSGTVALDAALVTSDVISRIRNGTAYVNVHTDDGVPPANTGPGDLPAGEIRGQIRKP